MDTQSLPPTTQPQETRTQFHQFQVSEPPASSQNTQQARNIKFKDFFTSRLMRTRSFEGGSASSPKDETLTWFEEFKAKLTKKSQAKQINQSISQQDDNQDDALGLSDNVSKSSRPTKSKHSYHKLDDLGCPSVRETCDKSSQNAAASLSRFNSETSSEYDGDIPLVDMSNASHKSTSKLHRPDSPTLIELRERKLHRISSINKPDFDTSSINTIYDRRDSRYKTNKKKNSSWFLSVFKRCNNLKLLIDYLFPFNCNLPWKILAIVSLTFVAIVLGITYNARELNTFGFFYGFLGGIVVSASCMALVLLSFLVKVLPKSDPDSSASIDNPTVELNEEREMRTPTKSPIMKECHDKFRDPADLSVLDSPSEDFSTFEVLDSGGKSQNQDSESDNRNDNLIDDEDYKGWMIEFIGDYELRNKAEVKLKLIYVRFEDHILYLCKPKNSDAESVTFPVFVQQRIYNLNNVKKFTANLLLPKSVRNRQKWVWSKKYPIKLEFEDEAEQQKGSEGSNVQLTLFAKSCREKEEWFRRFKKIFEDKKVAFGQSSKRLSFQSTASSALGDKQSIGGRPESRCQSPPLVKFDSVQTSKSSHALSDVNRRSDENSSSKVEALSTSGLVRTKSCELFPAEEPIDEPAQCPDNESIRFVSVAADDSTLTKETAELFSRAVEFSNFMESRPTLNYKDYIERIIDSTRDATATSDWFNSLTGRIFFDVFSHNYWSVWFKRKIQRKLYRIRLPYFMETLTLTEIDLGTNSPQFLNVVSHGFDSFGLSIDFDMAYSGGLTLTFETKLNLLKIKSDNTNQASNNSNTAPNSPTPQTNATQDSKPRDSSGSGDLSKSSESNQRSRSKQSTSSSGSARTSGESSDSDNSDSDSTSSSSDEEPDADEISDWEDYGAEKTRQSIVRFVDKIASSRYFQQATENRYIKKKLQDISNCPLVLVVKIVSLNGVLTLNVPPPQTDRVWYGFKPNPELTLRALPKMGDREVNLSPVTDWIERKLAEEFRKILVIPNMEDIVLPILKSDHLLYVTTTK